MRLLYLLLIGLASFAASAGPALPSAELTRAVVGLSGGLSDGASTLDTASIQAYELPGEVAVLFTLEGPGGGNGSLQFIAFFAPGRGGGLSHRRQTRYRLLAYEKIGARGSRLFLSRSGVVQRKYLELKGAAYRSNDPLCCPSLQLRSSFTRQGGQVLEQALAPNNSFKPKPLRGSA
jgi:hypothetical protein